MPLKIKSAILCDLIRTEDTGKQILIGVYTGNVIFKTRPGVLVPTFWIEFIPPSGKDAFDVDIKIDAPGLKNPQTAAAKGHIELGQNVVLAFTAPPMEIIQAGILQLSIRPKGERWQKALVKEVEFAESAPPAS